jgi:hypothetical protein
VKNYRLGFIAQKPDAPKRWLRISLYVLGGLAALFVLSNLVMWLVYRGKVLPNYRVAAVPVGSIPFDELDKKVDARAVLPAKITLSKDDKKQEFAPKDIGVAIDWPATKQALEKSRPWLPVLSLVSQHKVAATLRLDQAQFDVKAKQLEAQFTKAALPERIVLKGDNFKIAASEKGYKLDVPTLKSQLVDTVKQGQTNIAAPTLPLTSSEPTGKLGGDLALLQTRLASSITLHYGGKSTKLSRSQIGHFYASAGQGMELSNKNISRVIGEVAEDFGIAAVNQNEAVYASLYALLKGKTVNFLLATNSSRVYHYCAAVKGVSASYLPEFRRKLAAVYGDPQGWNRAGVALVYAESGCDYTAWLTAASQVTDFSSTICDNYYSCRVGANVIINYDRWVGATDPWNAAGGTLEDYRVMVINHETGHWFGFAHRTCPGAGQPAPVMQQQSISLQGCSFNPWPTAAEISSL